MVIRVNDVHKRFKAHGDKGHSLKEKLLFKNRRAYKENWVIKGISFEAGRGESIGLIGENGCGKSTLLKMMTRIMYPEKGSIEIQGRVSSLIELGAGFHPHMSGRENIYTNAAIFGLSRKEISKRVQSIINFSELGEYIDSPVRTYSSGMYMRLAFSVAIHVDADVLLIDEILAVGDANFQAKCFEKLRELKAAGVTTVIVTHDMGTVERFCTQAHWILDGKIAASGKAANVVDEYLAYMNKKHYERIEAEAQETQPDESVENLATAEESAAIETNPTSTRFGLRHAVITKARMLDANKKEKTVFRSGEPITIDIYYKRNKAHENYVFGFAIATLEMFIVSGTNTMLDKISIPKLRETGKVSVSFDKLPLAVGKYILQLAITDENEVPLDYCRDFLRFDIVADKRFAGIVSLSHKWTIN